MKTLIKNMKGVKMKKYLYVLESRKQLFSNHSISVISIRLDLLNFALQSPFRVILFRIVVFYYKQSGSGYLYLHLLYIYM